ncbi:MFS transporter [Streptomyces sp. NPDC032472]|uniref:MFS transporter n=1 Tax=Streptomyces sp. NPDC032472 TaxID=3155018 RepID=UPI0033F04003
MTSPTPAAGPAPARPLSRRLVLILSLTCAVAVGNLYFPQAIGPLIATGLDVPPDAASLVVTATQIGYTAGMVLLVPLGDRFRNRPLLVVLLALTGLALLGAGCAPALAPLVAASGLVGLTTVAAQVIGPMAAGMVAPERQGAVIGTLLSGSTAGMLLARTFSGVLGEWLGWRAPYLVASVVALLLAAVMAYAVPQTTPSESAVRRPYAEFLTQPLRLLLAEPELRRSCFYQAVVFGGFSAAWTSVALLLTGPVYGRGAQAVGLLALVGGATIVCTPYVGRLVDRHGPAPVNLVCLLGVVVSAGVLAVGGLGGAAGLAALTAGMLLLDVAMQGGMVANKARVYAVRPDARSRLTTAYMTCSYLGGTAGSWLGVRACTAYGWPAVCALIALLAAAGLVRHRFGPNGGTACMDDGRHVERMAVTHHPPHRGER